MNRKTFAVAALAVAASAGAFLAGALHAQAQPSDPEHPAAALELIAGDRDTAVYHFKHEGHTCYLASTRGGSGISLQCLK